MELYIYDSDLSLLGVLDEIKALVWTRRYWSCGEFALLVPMTPRHAELLQNGCLITRKDADEAGQIRYMAITRDESGLEQIEVKGAFLTHWIGKRLLLDRLAMTAPTPDILARIVQENLIAPTDPRRTIPNLTLSATAPDAAAVSFCAEALENALDVCESRAKLAKLGFKITTDLRSLRHTFVVYKGLDRTSGQVENPVCIFSPDFDNILSQEYTHSVEHVATAVYVTGEKATSPLSGDSPPEDAPVVEVSLAGMIGLDRTESLFSASGVRRVYTEGGTEYRLTDAEYTALLTARGEQALDDKTERVSFSSFIDTRGHLRYKQDFDVGDRVTCVNQRWKIRIDARITQITESYESGKTDLEVTFGESLPTLSDAMKWR